MLPEGRTFYKMTGSGNDFVVLDATMTAGSEPMSPERISALCARGTGVGADGLVLLERDPEAAFRMSYFNRDGTRATLCGNAALCAARLGVELGIAEAAEFTLRTDAGMLVARLHQGRPEIDLQPVSLVSPDPGLALDAGEIRMGFVEVGVPHLVVLCPDVDVVDVLARGAALRWHPRLEKGANVNFVSGGEGAWRYRTYERGVEDETLACGTGAVAVAILLAEWALAGPESTLVTRSGLRLGVRLRRQSRQWLPSLSGEGRLVFTGRLAEI